jgi:hypothetical protein
MRIPQFPRSIATPRRRILFGLVCGLIGGLVGYGWGQDGRLAALTNVHIEEAGLRFDARLDTGATISSINAREIEVIGGTATPQLSDAGKQVRFTVENNAGERARVESRIEEVRGILTSDCSELRYHVYLTVIHDRQAYRLLMNLNDRSRSKDKLLLGRNWLSHGFAVDVSKT